jgi:hypothetical protein
MAVIAIGTYIEIRQRNGAYIDQYQWQNFHQDETRTYNNRTYNYAGFGFSGSSIDVSAASITAGLVFSLNQLDVNIFKEASDNRYLCYIHNVWLDPDTFDETGLYSTEIHEILGFSHNQTRLTVRLGSPSDAITAEVPRRRLTTAMVGQLPTSGSIPLT